MPDPLEPIELTGRTLAKYIDALESAYAANPPRFDQMMLVHLTKQRSVYSLARDLKTIFFDVVQAANMEGWTAKLIAASLDGNPGNPQLRMFVRALGLDPIPESEEGNLQRVVTPRSTFQNAEVFRGEFGRRVDWTCQFRIPGGGGTGVLVASNLLLTNHHVIRNLLTDAALPPRVRCIFDFKMLNDGRQISPGREVALHTNWHVASRPHSPEDTRRDGQEPAADALDYAIVKLAESVGDEAMGPLGASDPASPPRGWMMLAAAAPVVDTNDPIIVLQHPLLPGRRFQEPVQMAIGVVLHSPFPDRRLRHNARTLPGSSGSPCFNSNLEMVALHHAGDPATGWEQPAWNQAIPIGPIVADLAARNVTPPFWN